MARSTIRSCNDQLRDSIAIIAGENHSVYVIKSLKYEAQSGQGEVQIWELESIASQGR